MKVRCKFKGQDVQLICTVVSDAGACVLATRAGYKIFSLSALAILFSNFARLLNMTEVLLTRLFESNMKDAAAYTNNL